MPKTKETNTASDVITEAAQRVGWAVMAAAMTLSLLELPSDAKQIILPNQPALEWVGQSENGNNQIRREREETAPHFISYSVVQRTPARSGRG